MIPVTQDVFGPNGNCMAACIASILELPLKEVPNFAEHNYKADGSAWRNAMQFLYDRGLILVGHHMFEVGAKLPDFDALPEHLKNCGPYYLQCGPAERGFEHCTVGWRGKVIHDPHPSRAGLLSTNDTYFFRARTDADA
jgi:hypothetical protein